jgi:hypothetical protein
MIALQQNGKLRERQTDATVAHCWHIHRDFSNGLSITAAQVPLVRDAGSLQSAVGCRHVSGLLVQPFFTTARPDVVREVGPYHLHGLDTSDPRRLIVSAWIGIVPENARSSRRDSPRRAIAICAHYLLTA